MESMLNIKYQLEDNNVKQTFHERSGGLKNRLEEIRKQRGIRQEDLAVALEVTRQTIGSIENGRYNPSIILAFKIARYFGMPAEEIFLYEEGDDEKEQ